MMKLLLLFTLAIGTAQAGWYYHQPLVVDDVVVGELETIRASRGLEGPVTITTRPTGYEIKEIVRDAKVPIFVAEPGYVYISEIHPVPGKRTMVSVRGREGLPVHTLVSPYQGDVYPGMHEPACYGYSLKNTIYYGRQALEGFDVCITGDPVYMNIWVDEPTEISVGVFSSRIR